jgi:hypothetical protein
MAGGWDSNLGHMEEQDPDQIQIQVMPGSSKLPAGDFVSSPPISVFQVRSGSPQLAGLDDDDDDDDSRYSFPTVLESAQSLRTRERNTYAWGRSMPSSSSSSSSSLLPQTFAPLSSAVTHTISAHTPLEHEEADRSGSIAMLVSTNPRAAVSLVSEIGSLTSSHTKGGSFTGEPLVSFPNDILFVSSSRLPASESENSSHATHTPKGCSFSGGPHSPSYGDIPDVDDEDRREEDLYPVRLAEMMYSSR